MKVGIFLKGNVDVLLPADNSVYSLLWYSRKKRKIKKISFVVLQFAETCNGIVSEFKNYDYVS